MPDRARINSASHDAEAHPKTNKPPAPVPAGPAGTTSIPLGGALGGAVDLNLLSPALLIALQRTVGNQAVLRLLDRRSPKGGAVGTPGIQRKIVDTDEILGGIPDLLEGNKLLGTGTALTLDTPLKQLGDVTLRQYITQIVANYETHFMASAKDDETRNVMKIVAALSSIGKLIARLLNAPMEHGKITKALLAGLKDRLIAALTGGSKETGEIAKAESSLTLAGTLGGDDPVGLFLQNKITLRKAVDRIRAMAKDAGKTPDEIFELLSQQYQSMLGAYKESQVKTAEREVDPKAPTFHLADLYGEISPDYFRNLLDLKEGSVQWGEKGIQFKDPKERKTWKALDFEWRANDLEELRKAVAKLPESETIPDLTETQRSERGLGAAQREAGEIPARRGEG